MNDRILFQKDRLTVSETKLTIGHSIVLYPSITATSIYEGRPLIVLGVVGLVGLLPLAIVSLMGASRTGTMFPSTGSALVLLALIAMAVIGFTYRVQCLLISVQGSSVTALRSKARIELEVAQRAIEEAKRSYETKIMKHWSRY
jgi:hypothetical protein